MTAAQPEPADEFDSYDVLNFKTPERDASGDVVPFTLDDDPHVLVAVRPKQAILIELGVGMVSDDPMEQLRCYLLFKDSVLREDSAAYLNAKFQDPKDTTDLDVLEPILQTVMGLWYDRPTKRPAASASSPPRTGPRSTARRHS